MRACDRCRVHGRQTALFAEAGGNRCVGVSEGFGANIVNKVRLVLVSRDLWVRACMWRGYVQDRGPTALTGLAPKTSRLACIEFGSLVSPRAHACGQRTRAWAVLDRSMARACANQLEPHTLSRSIDPDRVLGHAIATFDL